MGRARRNRKSDNRSDNRIENENRIESDNRNENRTRPIDDCFALYILFKKLHMLFVY